MFIGAIGFNHTAPAIRRFTDGWDAFTWMCKYWTRYPISVQKYADKGILAGAMIGAVDVHGPGDISVYASPNC